MGLINVKKNSINFGKHVSLIRITINIKNNTEKIINNNIPNNIENTVATK